MPVPPVRVQPASPSHGPTALAVVVLVMVVLPGCRPAADVRPGDVRSYAVPKDAEPQPVARADGDASGPRDDVAPLPLKVRYDVPEGWSDRGADGLRVATLLIGDPADRREVTVIPASGSLDGNVIRWQGQLDAAAGAEELAERAATAIAAAERVQVGSSTATIVLLRDAAAAGGADGQAILAAMIPVDERRSLFVKFRGDAALAALHRERFVRFVSSIRWEE